MAIKMGLGEYNTYIIDPSDNQVYDVTAIPKVKISNLPTKAVQVDGALHHWGFVDDAGNAYAWGDNSAGWAGVGTPAHLATPQLVFTNVDFIHTYATTHGDGIAFIRKDGTLWFVGYIPGSATPVQTPTQFSFPAGTFIKDIWFGGAAFALDSSGQAWSWGDPGWPASRLLGQGTDSPNMSVPGKVDLPGPCVALCAGTAMHYLLADGSLYGSAKNPLMIGLPATTGSYNKPQLLSWASKLPAAIKQISCNSSATYAILADGSMWTWGDNSHGGCGIGVELDYTKTTPTYTWNWGDDDLPQAPVQTGIGATWAHLKRGIALVFYMFAEDVNDVLYSTGRNKFNVLGNGVVSSDPTGTDYSLHPNAWDVTWWTPVDPLHLTIPIHTPVPPIPLPAAPTGTITPITITSVQNADGSWTLTGSSSGNPIIKWYWQVTSGVVSPFIATSSRIILKGLTPGVYTIQLTATGNNWVPYVATTSITVAAVPCPSIVKVQTVITWSDGHTTTY